MKKKVKLWLLVVGMLILVLTGCGKSAQDEFTDNLDEQATNKNYNAAEFSIKFDELSVETGTDDASSSATVNLVISQLKDMELSGDFLLDSDAKAIDYSFEVKVMGQTIPLDFIMSEDAIYYSGDSFSQIFDLVQSFAGESMGVDLSAAAEAVSGKYVKLDQDDISENAGTSFDFSSLTAETEGNTILSEYAKTLDKDSFEKKDDVVTHTFNKQELIDLIKYAKENGTDEVKDTLSSIDEADLESEELKDFEKLDLTVSINTKTNKATYKIAVGYKDDEGNKADVGMSMTVTPKEDDKKVAIPSDSDTVSLEDFSALMEDNAKVTVSDENFETLLENIEAAKDTYTKEEIYEQLEDFSLTAEQKAKIDAIYE